MAAKLLGNDEIMSLASSIPNWEINEKHIKSEWEFKSFIDAFAFITKIAMLSESMNHHPEWTNVYSNVKIKLTTHDLGGISNLDFELAKSINQLN